MTLFSWARIGSPLLALFALPLACGGGKEGGDGDGGSGGGNAMSSGGAFDGGGGETGDGDANGGTNSGGGDGDGDGNGPTGGSGNDPTRACSSTECSGNCAPLDASATTCDDVWNCTEAVACARDLVSYCGCDGMTFEGSSNCAPFAFAHRGGCDEGSAGGLNCDASQVVTDDLPPECEYGYLPEVVQGSWGNCVAIEECGCKTSGSADECGLEYVCYNTGRCGHLLTKTVR